MYSDLAIFSGRAHPELAQSICSRLGRQLGKIDVFEFTNENIFVQYQENIRQKDIYLVQSFSSPVNTSIVELLIMIDAAKRASAGRITAVIPYFAYGRSDKKDQPRVPITARLMANLIETAGADRVLTQNLHAGQIQGFFNIPVDELNALYPVSIHFRNQRLENYTVVATDVGDEKRARDMAVRLGMPLAIIDKRRHGNSGVTEAMHVIGEVEGRNVLILDDEIDSAGTIVAAVNAVRVNGCKEVIVSGYHPILSGPAI
ncbi:MAG: ribose-phosphate diphosphokinase, partial [Tepidiformaceae bacterium]